MNWYLPSALTDSPFLSTRCFESRLFGYLEYIRDELAEQDAKRQDGRCSIPDAYGGLKRCPCRVKNPDYIPGGDQPKTLPVRCEGCIYEQFRQAHTPIVVSALDHENEAGEFESFEIPATKDMLAADRFLELRQEFIAFVRERIPSWQTRQS